MDKRLDASRSYHEQDVPSHSKKSKKRSSKRNSNIAPWMSNPQSDQNNDMISGMEYSHVMWPPNIQQTFAANGRRLFTAASDPSVCGYTPMPLTYAMEPVSLPPMYRLYPSVPVPGIKTIPSGTRRQCQQNNPVNLGFNASTMTNGYASLQENGSDTPIHGNYQNGDYTSLPPTANKNNGINGDELSAEHRRYSDPGIGSAEAPIQAQSDDSDSVDSSSSVTTIGRSNKLVLSLIEQMTELKKSNSQLFKELNEAKSELETVKVKLVQCKHNSSSDYQPGMLSDLIREIREANKACEEALVSKVKLMMEEKFNQKSAEIDKLNSQVLKLIKDKEESDRHVAKLEEEVATLKINANNEGREIAAFEEETLSLRRELQEARASRTLAENHAAKLEKLVEILREKMNVAPGQELVSTPEVRKSTPEVRKSTPEVRKSTPEVRKSTMITHIQSENGTSSSSSTENEEDEDDDDEDDDNNVEPPKKPSTIEKLSTNSNDFKVAIMENGINLSGPVTDL